MALLLGGCAADVVQNMQIPLRNPTAPLGGTTRFDATRFAGNWETVACLGICDERVRYVVATDGILVRRVGELKTPYTISAPGVLREMDSKRTLVVMWVDEGFRTAAVGDADGRWAAILNRDRTGGADRIRAAREVLDFNGWDVSQLQDVGG